MSVEDVGGEGGGAAEIYSRHRHSAQPESRQVCAVLGAVLEVVAAENLQPTPSTLFAAIMTSLDKTEAQSSPEVPRPTLGHQRDGRTRMCVWLNTSLRLGFRKNFSLLPDRVQVCTAFLTVLAAVLARMSTAVLRSKFSMSSQLICSILQQHEAEVLPKPQIAAARLHCAILARAAATAETMQTTMVAGMQASVAKAALACLSHVLAAVSPSDWPLASEPMMLLLRSCIDSRPKVRRRAQSGLVEVLAALQRSSAIADASALVAKGKVLHTCEAEGTCWQTEATVAALV